MRKVRVAVFLVVGTLLGLLAAWEVHNLFFFHDRVWARGVHSFDYVLMAVFPLAFGLAAVACLRSALSDWRSPRTHATPGSKLTPG